MPIPTTKVAATDPRSRRRDASAIWTGLQRAQHAVEQGNVRDVFERLSGGSTESYNAIKTVLADLSEFHDLIDEALARRADVEAVHLRETGNAVDYRATFGAHRAHLKAVLDAVEPDIPTTTETRTQNATTGKIDVSTHQVTAAEPIGAALLATLPAVFADMT